MAETLRNGSLAKQTQFASSASSRGSVAAGAVVFNVGTVTMTPMRGIVSGSYVYWNSPTANSAGYTGGGVLTDVVQNGPAVASIS